MVLEEGQQAAYQEIPPNNGRPWWKKKRKISSFWMKKKLEELSEHFNPIPFPPKEGPLDIAPHQVLLTRLGLWDFLNLDFDQEIRIDLIKELVVCYKKSRSLHKSSVHGMTISLGRSHLAEALHLSNLKVNGNREDWNFVLSQEEASFLEELISGWLVLKDDDDSEEEVDDYIMKVNRSIKEMRFEEADWAGLIWFMVKRELSKGKNLGNCHYASHLQLLLKHQKAELFFENRDDDIIVKCNKRKREFLAKLQKEESKRPDLTDSGCTVTDFQAFDWARRASDTTMDSFMQEERHEEGLKVEGSTDLMIGAMDDLNREEIKHQPSNLISNEEGETNLSSGEKVEHGFKTERKLTMESGNNENEGNEVLVNEEVCGIGTVDSLDNEEQILPREQVALNAEKQASDSDIAFKENDYQGKHTNNFIKSDDKNVESNVSHVNDFQNCASVEAMQATLNACQVTFGSDNVEEIKNEETLELDHGGLRLVVHSVMGDRADKAECEANTGISHEVLCEKGDEATGGECEANIGNSIHVQCEEKDDATEDKANEASREVHVGNSLDVQCKEGEDVMEDMEIEAVCEANIGNSHEAHCERDVIIEDDATGAELEANTGKSVYVHCKKIEKVMEDEANKASYEVNVWNSLEVHCQKDDNVMEDQVNTADCEANPGNSHEVRCEKGEANVGNSVDVHYEEKNVMEDNEIEAALEANIGNSLELLCEKTDVLMEDKENEAALEANVGNSVEVHCEKIDDVMEDKDIKTAFDVNIVNSLELNHEKGDVVMEDMENKAASGANMGNSLELHCEKDDVVMEDKENEAAHEANISNSLNEELKNVQDQHQLELNFKNTSEKKRDSLADFAGEEMDYQVAFNSMMDSAGKEAESVASVDLLMTQVADEEGVKRECSTVLLLSEIDGLDSQEIGNAVHLVSCEGNSGKMFILKSSGKEGKHSIHGDVNNSDEGFTMEMEYSGSGLRLMQYDKEDNGMRTLVNEEACEEKLGVLLDNKENDLHKVQIALVSEEHNAKCMNASMEGVKQQEPGLSEYSKSGEGNVELQASNLNEFLAAGVDSLQVTLNEKQGKEESDHVPETEGLDAVVWKYDKEDQEKCQTSEGFVLQPCSGKKSHVPEEASQAQCTDCDYPQKKCHHLGSLYSADILQLISTKEVIQSLPSYDIGHSFAVSNSNASPEKMFLSPHGMALQNKDICGTEVSVEHFASETQKNADLAGFNYGNPMKREMDCLDDGHYGHGIENRNTIDSTDGSVEGFMDLDFCTQQVAVWMERMKNAARKNVQDSQGSNEMLLKKIEEQSQIIQQYEILMHKEQQQKQKEQQQKQKDVRRYEVELRLMQSVVQDYRRALKEVHHSFEKYRERCQFPDESLYMDHPGGGGRVILVSEWKKEEQEHEKKTRSVIKAVMKDFEEEWIGKWKGHLDSFDFYCDRLEDLEFEMGRLKKGKGLKP